MFIQDLMELREKRARAQVAKQTAKDVAIGLGIGIALGTVAGLLLAPKSGKETMEDIAAGTKEVIGQVKDQVDETSKILKRELDSEEVSKSVQAISKKVEEKAKEVKTRMKKGAAEKEPTVLKKKVA